MGQSEMDEDRSQQPPDFPMPNFRQTAQPRQNTPFHVIFRNVHPQDWFDVLTKTRNQCSGDADENEYPRQITHPQSAARKKPAPVVESLFRGLVGFLRLFHFSAATRAAC